MQRTDLRGPTPRRAATYSPPRQYTTPFDPQQLWQALFSGAARPLRFALIGGLCAGIQLGLLFGLTRAGLLPVPGNIAAYLLSAQANFLLSDRFIWHDRRGRGSGSRLPRRWLAFHLSIAGTFLLNEAVFIAARTVMPDLPAAAAGIAVSAIVNFLIQDRLTFRRAG